MAQTGFMLIPHDTEDFSERNRICRGAREQVSFCHGSLCVTNMADVTVKLQD